MGKGLTPAQEAFCRAVVETGNQSEAYRRAYPRSKNWKDQSVWTNSSTLMADMKVAQRVSELQANLAKKAEVTAMELIESNRAIRDNSMRIDPETGNMVNPLAAIRANELNAKLTGLLRDQQVTNIAIVVHGGIDPSLILTGGTTVDVDP